MKFTNVFCSVLLITLNLVVGDVIKVDDHSLINNNVASCVINEVRVLPCPEAAKEKPCKLYKGTTVQVEVDFTPGFQATNLKAELVWDPGFDVELPLPGMDMDGCKSTQCPTTKNEMQTYSYGLSVLDFFPSKKYPVKLRLTNIDDNTQQCCSKFEIEIKNRKKQV